MHARIARPPASWCTRRPQQRKQATSKFCGVQLRHVANHKRSRLHRPPHAEQSALGSGPQLQCNTFANIH
eukprot:7826415-Alexandrium_andersonii.AAC.1